MLCERWNIDLHLFYFRAGQWEAASSLNWMPVTWALRPCDSFCPAWWSGGKRESVNDDIFVLLRHRPLIFLFMAAALCGVVSAFSPPAWLINKIGTLNSRCEQDIMRAGWQRESKCFSAGGKESVRFKMHRDMWLSPLIYLGHNPFFLPLNT